MEDTEVLNEVENGWRMFSARWQQAASVGKISREILEMQRVFYYAATRHAIIMIAKAGEQEMLRNPQHGAEHLAERLQRMLGLVEMHAAIGRAQRSSRIPRVTTRRLHRLLRTGIVVLGTLVLLAKSRWQ
jgi:hypothetical protein